MGLFRGGGEGKRIAVANREVTCQRVGDTLPYLLAAVS